MGRYVRLPTARNDWRLMGRTARLVLTIPVYAVVALLVSIVTLTAFVVSQNLTLVSDLIIGGSLPLADRVSILLELYPFVGTSFTVPQGLLLVAVAVLTGVDVAMVGYHFRRHGLSLSSGGGSALGVLLGTLGAGCAACGSVVLLGVLSLVGVQASLLFLPFDGLEFAIAALGMLTLSIFWLADGMRGGMINGCPIDL